MAQHATVRHSAQVSAYIYIYIYTLLLYIYIYIIVIYIYIYIYIYIIYTLLLQNNNVYKIYNYSNAWIRCFVVLCVCVCVCVTHGIGQPQLYYIHRCWQPQLHCHDKVQYNMSYQLYVADTHIVFDQFCDISLR